MKLPLGASVGKREDVEDIPLFCPEVGQMFILKPFNRRHKYFKNKTQPCKKEGPSLPGLRSKSCPLRSGQEGGREVAPVTLSSKATLWTLCWYAEGQAWSLD